MQNVVTLFLVVFWAVMLIQDIIDYIENKFLFRKYTLFRFIITIIISFSLAFNIGNLVGWI